MSHCVVWVPGEAFGIPKVDQRAWVIASDNERGTVILRSCGRPDVIAELEVGRILGVEIDNMTLRFRNPDVNWNPL